jgi:hypothetical protein
VRNVIALIVLVLGAAACGDNLKPTGPSHVAASSVGGAQVARSSSYTLVSSVSALRQPVQKSSHTTLRSGLGAQ